MMKQYFWTLRYNNDLIIQILKESFVNLIAQHKAETIPLAFDLTKQPSQIDEENKDTPIASSTQEISLTPYYTKFDDKAQKMLLEDACAYVDNEIASLKEKIAKAEQDIMRFQQGGK